MFGHPCCIVYWNRIILKVCVIIVLYTQRRLSRFLKWMWFFFINQTEPCESPCIHRTAAVSSLIISCRIMQHNDIIILYPTASRKTSPRLCTVNGVLGRRSRPGTLIKAPCSRSVGTTAETRVRSRPLPICVRIRQVSAARRSRVLRCRRSRTKSRFTYIILYFDNTSLSRWRRINWSSAPPPCCGGRVLPPPPPTSFPRPVAKSRLQQTPPKDCPAWPTFHE